MHTDLIAVRLLHDLLPSLVVNAPSFQLTQDPSKDQIFVGFEDGQVLCFNIAETNGAEEAGKDDESVTESEDFVLCRVEELVRYVSIIRFLRLFFILFFLFHFFRLFLSFFLGLQTKTIVF